MATRQIEYEFSGDLSGIQQTLQKLTRALEGLVGDASQAAGRITDEFNSVDADITSNIEITGLEEAEEGFRSLSGTASFEGLEQGLGGAKEQASGLAQNVGDVNQSVDATSGISGSAAAAVGALSGGFAELGENLVEAGQVGKVKQALDGALGIDPTPIELLSSNFDDLFDSLKSIASADFEGALSSIGRMASTTAKSGFLIASAFAAAAVAFGTAATAAADTELALGRIERQSGATSSEILGFQAALNKVGEQSDLDEVADLLSEVRRGISEAAETGGEGAEAIADLGLSLSEIDSASPVEAIEMLDGALKGLSASAKQQKLEDLFGESDSRRILSIMDAGTESITEFSDVITGKQAKALETWGQSLNSLQTQLSLLLRQVGGEGAQALDGFGQLLKPIGQLLLDTARFTSKLVSAVFNLTSALFELVGMIPGVTETLTALGGAYESVRDAVFGAFDAVNDWLDFNSEVEDDGPAEAQEGYARATDLAAKANEDFADTHRDLRDEMDRGLIDEETFLQGMVSAAEDRFQKLRELDRRFPGIDLSANVDAAASILRQLQDQLEEAGPITVEVEAESESSGGTEEAPEMPDMPDVPTFEAEDETIDFDVGEFSSFEFLNTMLGEINDRFEFGIDSVSDYRSKLKEMKTAVKSSNASQLEQAEILKEIQDQLKATSKSYQVLTTAAQQASFSLGSNIASSVGNFLRGSSESLSDVERQELEKRKRTLFASLQSQQISYQEYAAKIQQIDNELTESVIGNVNSIQDAFVEGFKTIGDFVIDIIQSIIQQLVAAIAKALILKSLSGLGVMSDVGSFGSIIGGALGAGGGASATIANVNVQGSSRLVGNDIRTSYDKQITTNSRVFG